MNTNLSEVPRVGEQAHDAVVVTAGLTISNTIGRLLRSHAGRGPTKARTVMSSDLVVVTLRDCLTTAERTLVDADLTEYVKRTRDVLYEAIRGAATAVVEEVTGKRVVAFLAAQHHDPDIAVLTFVVDPNGAHAGRSVG